MAPSHDPEIAELLMTTRRLTSEAATLSKTIQATLEELQEFRSSLHRADRRPRIAPERGGDHD